MTAEAVRSKRVLKNNNKQKTAKGDGEKKSTKDGSKRGKEKEEKKEESVKGKRYAINEKSDKTRKTREPGPRRGMICKRCAHTIDGHPTLHSFETDEGYCHSEAIYDTRSKRLYSCKGEVWNSRDGPPSGTTTTRLLPSPGTKQSLSALTRKASEAKFTNSFTETVADEEKKEISQTLDGKGKKECKTLEKDKEERKQSPEEEKIEKTPNKQGTRGLPPDVRVIILDGTSGRFRTMTDEELSFLDSGNNCTQTQASTNAADPLGSYAGSVKKSRPTKRKLAEVTKDAENSSTTSSSTTDPSKRPKKKIKRNPKPLTPIASPEPSNPTAGEAYDIRATKTNVPEPESDGVIANSEEGAGAQVTAELTLEQMRAFLAGLAKIACCDDPTFLRRELISIDGMLNSLGAPSR
jgi:hypothetical protein